MQLTEQEVIKAQSKRIAILNQTIGQLELDMDFKDAYILKLEAELKARHEHEEQNEETERNAE
ncbi:hypothetical protein QUF79_14665 [Fictibacillus enclensis]|uniref:hypothetical protein n=1 Tax=Fictibacillus enclensis TaxID=1017270 RepID=UPI0025A2D273|nr:hypothetical protein [Fictibacillus enclensis]MDM5199261.1 hypothetical protein [Fictibacillus enclensis]